MATNVAITSKTAAETSSAITVADGASIKVWVSEFLTGGESVSIIQTDGSSVEIPLVVYDQEEKAPWVVQIVPGITSVRLVGPGTFKLEKTVTATATAVYYDT